MLVLDVADFRSTTSWRAELREENGRPLAAHRAELDGESAEFELLSDLYGGLWRLDVDPVRRDASARRLLGRVGDYVTTEVFGEIAVALAERAPATVVLRLPAAATQLSALPLELARVSGRSLVEAGVVIAHQLAGEDEGAAATAGTEGGRPEGVAGPGEDGRPLRVLAVFALPEGLSALSLVRERRTLTGLLRDLSEISGRRIETRILQYGATREALETALADPKGWDVVHLSGHGGPGSLQFESENGGRQRVDRGELVAMFRPCAGRIGLVVLSSCESGALQALRRRGVTTADRRLEPTPHGEPARRRGSGRSGAPSGPPAGSAAPSVLPSLGHELAAAVGCVVLAMRFPVEDRFSVALSAAWYEALLQDGVTAGEALGRAVRQESQARGRSLVSAVTPVLLGDPGFRLAAARPRSGSRPRRTGPPETRPPSPGAAEPGRRSDRPPPPPDLFVGRTALIARLRGMLLPTSDRRGPVVVVGAPGSGRTSFLAEAVQGFGDQFGEVRWRRATPPTVPASLLRPARSEGGPHPGTLVVLDGADALLTADGSWRDAATPTRLAQYLARPGQRLVLMSDRTLAEPPEGTRTLVVGSLSRSESEWLARECQELAWGELGEGALLPHVGLPWLVCRGNPRLVQHCSDGSPALALGRTRRMDRAWEVTTPTPPPARPRGRPALGASHPGGRITVWATARAATLSAVPRRLFCVLSTLEAADRKPEVLDIVWPLMQELAGEQPTSHQRAAEALIANGLVEVAGPMLWVHPAAARAGRDLDPETTTLTATAAALFWQRHYEGFSTQADNPDEEYLGKVSACRVPYLMRLGQWEEASRCCEQAINHDRSPAMAARLLPFSTEIVESTRGTDLGRATRYVRTSLVLSLNPAGGLAALRDLYSEAAAAGDAGVMAACASTIVQESHRADPLDALDWLRQARSAAATAQFGPWPQLLLSLREAQILTQLGDDGEALHIAETVLDRIDRLLADGVPPDGVNPHSLSVAALDAAAAAAHGGGLPDLERRYRQRALDVSVAHGSGDRGQAEMQFNQIHELVRAGRLQEARELLLAARHHFSHPGDERELGLVLIELAGIEHLRGHDEDAAELTRQALRAAYAARQWLDAARAHQRLATFLASGHRPGRDPGTHLLAATVIYFRLLGSLSAFTPQPLIQKAVALLQFRTAKRPGDLPASMPDLTCALDEDCGVDLTPLIAGTERTAVRLGPDNELIMTMRAAPGTEGDSVADVLTMARRPPLPEALLDPPAHPAHWQEIADLVAASAGDPDLRWDVRDLCDNLISAGWADLVTGIRAFVAGERNLESLARPGTPEHQIMSWILERQDSGEDHS